MVPEDVNVDVEVGDLVELFLDFASAGMEGTI
jgi:hypothetical protein